VPHVRVTCEWALTTHSSQGTLETSVTPLLCAMLITRSKPPGAKQVTRASHEALAAFHQTSGVGRSHAADHFNEKMLLLAAFAPPVRGARALGQAPPAIH
jgi:hypothetical protein